MCREAGRKVTLPAAIFVNRVKTLADTLKGMKTLEEKQQELFGIWSQLGKVLKMFHQRGWYLRDVTYDNVVHVRMGATEGWTLLEFGNASRERSSLHKSTIPPRQVPPEVRRPASHACTSPHAPACHITTCVRRYKHIPACVPAARQACCVPSTRAHACSLPSMRAPSAARTGNAEPDG
jgi:hypothetical protein